MNGQAFSWSTMLAGVPQGSIVGPLFFLIYINDLNHNLSSTVKLFTDDTSILTIDFDINLYTKQLSDDVEKISDWAYQWKMPFNPDLSKEA